MTQQDALDILKLGYNVYLTGTAGSGKTFVLNEYIEYLKNNNVEVGITASTGVAATQINGMTINSWAGFGVKKQLTESDLEEILKRRYLRKRISNTKVLIIDEISMLPDYCLDMLDQICKAVKNSYEPFGGIQIILCGDFFQLPPVEKEYHEYQGEFVDVDKDIESKADSKTYGFIFKSQAWGSLHLKVCYLEKEYRQEDQEFLHVLREIRQNSISKPSIKILAARIYKPVTSVSTRLYTHNVDADAINDRELEKLDGSVKIYTMSVRGNEYLSRIMKKNCLAPETLRLKKDALVMFVKNNFDKGYVNGTLGTVLDYDVNGAPVVKIASGEQVVVSPAEWSIEEDGEIKAQIRQYPLRLAWAITIHKSQGMSLDAAEIDLRRPFVPGMGYVALSRVRCLEGIKLMGLNHKALQVNEEVIGLDRILQIESQKTLAELQSMDWIELQIMQKIFLTDMMHEYKKTFRFNYLQGRKK